MEKHILSVNFVLTAGEMYPALILIMQNIPERDFLSDLDRFEYTVALPAPSLYSQFNNVRDNDILLTALTLMGFDDVFEVQCRCRDCFGIITNLY